MDGLSRRQMLGSAGTLLGALYIHAWQLLDGLFDRRHPQLPLDAALPPGDSFSPAASPSIQPPGHSVKRHG